MDAPASLSDAVKNLLYAALGNLHTGKRESDMAKNTIVDTVADAVISAAAAIL